MTNTQTGCIIEFPNRSLQKEFVRITFDTLDGEVLLGLRKWYHTLDGPRPTQKGINVRLERAVQIAKAIISYAEQRQTTP